MKIAVITGASSGMGRQMAMEINDRIPNVEELWLIGRRMDRLQELEKLLDRKTRLFSMDLSRPESLQEYEQLLQREKPGIVFLVNAAGFGKIGEIWELSVQDQTAMLDVNVRALTAVTRSSLPFMTENSRIINFASSAAFLPQPDFAVYAASKSYVLSFSRALNQELKETGKSCRVTALCPGPVRTEFFGIAEQTGKIPVYKYLFMADPEKVVKKALQDSVLGEDMSVYGAGMQLFRLFSKLLPHRLIFLALQLGNRAAGKEK